MTGKEMKAVEQMFNQAVAEMDKRFNARFDAVANRFSRLDRIATSDHIDVDPGEWFFDDERDPTLTEWMDRVDARLSRLENLMMGKILD